jgi:uncharacterized protein (TIGR03435 family)
MMHRQTPTVVSVISVLAVAVLTAQSARPTFEVASVKLQPTRLEPTGPSGGREGRPSPGAGSIFRRSNATVANLIQFAYEVRDFQVLGGADWARKDLFEIAAKPTGDIQTERLMMRALLEDRFKLNVRHEQRDMKSYNVVVARKDGRLGPGLKRCEDPAVPQPRTAIRVPAGAYGFGISAWCGTLQSVVATAAGLLNAIVVDKTGLEGPWTYSFFVRDPTPSQSSLVRELADKEDLPTLSVALQDELGA